MRHRFAITLITLATYSQANAQSLKIDVRSNNYSDVSESKIEAFTSLFNKSSIIQSLVQNDHILDKNLFVDIILYDPLAFGELKLKSDLTISAEEYVDAWSTKRSLQSAILLLFVKGGEGQYQFKTLSVSEKLQDNFLLPLIVDFMKSKMTGNATQVVQIFGRMLEKVLVPVWTDAKVQSAEALLGEPRYKPYVVNTFHGWFRFGFFDFIPATSDQTKGLVEVSAIESKDQLSQDWFFSNKYFYTSDDYLKHFSASQVYDWNVSFAKDNSRNAYLFTDGFIYNILKYFEESNKHSSRNASEWNWVYNSKHDPVRYVTDLESFAARTPNDRMIISFNDGSSLKEGDPLPKMCPSSENTYCNIFQCDLANEVLFGKVFGDIHNGPWGTNQCASGLHYRICNDEMNFIEVTLEEAWKYAAKGFVVYCTSFHYTKDAGLINAPQNESNLCSSRSGHIAVCFPGIRNEKVFKQNLFIQAGADPGTRSYSEVWGANYDGKVRCHIYLGYLNN